MVARYGWVNDMAAVPEPDGSRHLFSVKAPAVSYAGVPFYWALMKVAPQLGLQVATDDSPQAARQAWFQATTFALRLFTIQLPCLAFLLWLERWLRGVSADPVLRLSAVAAAGLGTNYLAYALMFASHAPFAIAAFASFAITTSERARSPLDVKGRRLSRAFLAGFFAGMATILEYHVAGLVSVCLAVYALTAFWRPSRYAMFSLGAAINAAALMYFQWRCFKSPFTSGHKMSETPLYAHLLSQGYVGGVGKPDWDVFGKLSFDQGYGFFGTSPFMWLGLLAIPFALIAGYGTGREQAQRGGWRHDRLDADHARPLDDGERGHQLAWRVDARAPLPRRGPTVLRLRRPVRARGDRPAVAHAPRDRPRARRGGGGGERPHDRRRGDALQQPPRGHYPPAGRQFTWPMALAGFVPHHALELFGVESPALWYVAAGCAVGTAALGALAPWREKPWDPGCSAQRSSSSPSGRRWPPRSRSPSPSTAVTWSEHTRWSFVEGWRPVGRDRIAKLREDAERLGPRGPCVWQRLLWAERLVGRRMDAEPRSGQDAGSGPPGRLPRLRGSLRSARVPPPHSARSDGRDTRALEPTVMFPMQSPRDDLASRFPWPALPGGSEPPRWTGAGFRVDGRDEGVLAYFRESSGWSDELTAMHEAEAGAEHPIDLASRARAVSEVRRRLGAGSHRIVEVGCSSGYMLHELRREFPGSLVIGADYVGAPLRHLAREQPDLPLLQIDLDAVPAPSTPASMRWSPSTCSSTSRTTCARWGRFTASSGRGGWRTSRSPPGRGCSTCTTRC